MAMSRLLLLALPCLALAGECGHSEAPAGGEQCGQADGVAEEAQVTMLQRSFELQDGKLVASAAPEPAPAVAAAPANSSEGRLVEVPAQRLVSLASVNGPLDPMPASGDPDCPCIGITGRDGEVIFNTSGLNVTYPIDAGSSCQRWDMDRHMDCRNANYPMVDPAWCVAKWCFVDPCNCKPRDPSVLPHPSAYIPNALYQQKRVYYSYEACGEQDTWTTKNNNAACQTKQTSFDCVSTSGCAWTLDQGCVGEELAGSTCSQNFVRDSLTWGRTECQCVGFTELSGFAVAHAPQSGNGTDEAASTLDFNLSASVGSTCKAWDDGAHPACQGSGSKPDWCTKRWCLVDPCKCGLDTPPKISTYFTGAKWLTHQVYYSYAACGETDTYTEAENPTACVNQQDEAACGRQGDKCRWTTMNDRLTCLGKDLATLCNDGVPPPLARSGAPREASTLPGASALLAALLLGRAWA
mmetsp:Transcript_97725/g.309894  ORF Transcript_97725/g.309894 Transcript_97725/m.309894 type:complete len:467 (-) Transcript_97725:323-1723(-)